MAKSGSLSRDIDLDILSLPSHDNILRDRVENFSFNWWDNSNVRIFSRLLIDNLHYPAYPGSSYSRFRQLQSCSRYAQ